MTMMSELRTASQLPPRLESYSRLIICPLGTYVKHLLTNYRYYLWYLISSPLGSVKPNILNTITLL